MKGEISLNGVKSTRFNFNRLDGGDPIINKKNSKIYSKLKYIKKNYQLYLFFTLPPTNTVNYF